MLIITLTFFQTRTHVVSRKTTHIKRPQIDLQTPSDTDSDSSKMVRGAKDSGKMSVDKLKKKSKNRFCEDCQAETEKGVDMFRIHRTGRTVCKDCWIRMDPEKSTNKNKRKRNITDPSDTKSCKVFLKDVLTSPTSADSQSYKVAKGEDGSVVYKVTDDSSSNESTLSTKTKAQLKQLPDMKEPLRVLPKRNRKISETVEISDSESEVDTKRKTRRREKIVSPKTDEKPTNVEKSTKSGKSKPTKVEIPATKTKSKRANGNQSSDSEASRTKRSRSSSVESFVGTTRSLRPQRKAALSRIVGDNDSVTSDDSSQVEYIPKGSRKRNESVGSKDKKTSSISSKESSPAVKFKSPPNVKPPEAKKPLARPKRKKDVEERISYTCAACGIDFDENKEYKLHQEMHLKNVEIKIQRVIVDETLEIKDENERLPSIEEEPEQDENEKQEKLKEIEMRIQDTENPEELEDNNEVEILDDTEFQDKAESSVEDKSKLSDEVRSKSTVEAKSKPTVDSKKKSTVEEKTKSSAESKNKSTVEDKSKSTVEDESKSTVEDKSKLAVEDKSQSAVEGEVELIQDDEIESAQSNKVESTQKAKTESGEENKSKSIKEDTKLAEDKTESIQKDEIKSVQEEKAVSVQDENSEPVIEKGRKESTQEEKSELISTEDKVTEEKSQDGDSQDEERENLEELLQREELEVIDEVVDSASSAIDPDEEHDKENFDEKNASVEEESEVDFKVADTGSSEETLEETFKVSFESPAETEKCVEDLSNTETEPKEKESSEQTDLLERKDSLDKEISLDKEDFLEKECSSNKGCPLEKEGSLEKEDSLEKKDSLKNEGSSEKEGFLEKEKSLEKEDSSKEQDSLEEEDSSKKDSSESAQKTLSPHSTPTRDTLEDELIKDDQVVHDNTEKENEKESDNKTIEDNEVIDDKQEKSEVIEDQVESIVADVVVSETQDILETNSISSKTNKENLEQESLNKEITSTVQNGLEQLGNQIDDKNKIEDSHVENEPVSKAETTATEVLEEVFDLATSQVDEKQDSEKTSSISVPLQDNLEEISNDALNGSDMPSLEADDSGINNL